MNDLLHILQQKDRCPLCARWCDFRLPWLLNDLLHTLHENGRSPYKCGDESSDDPVD
jgi:hypothetical protein